MSSCHQTSQDTRQLFLWWHLGTHPGHHSLRSGVVVPIPRAIASEHPWLSPVDTETPAGLLALPPSPTRSLNPRLCLVSDGLWLKHQEEAEGHSLYLLKTSVLRVFRDGVGVSLLTYYYPPSLQLIYLKVCQHQDLMRSWPLLPADGSRANNSFFSSLANRGCEQWSSRALE